MRLSVASKEKFFFRELCAFRGSYLSVLQGRAGLGESEGVERD